jgi:hypothetical protein
LEILAIGVWAAILIVVSVRVFFWPNAHSVYPIFATAGRHWRDAQELYYPYFYQPEIDVYRYSPLVAALFLPLSQLPEGLGNVCWRWLCAGCYLGALGWWSRSVLPRTLTSPQQAMLFLLAAPLSIGCVNNGQSNVLLIGLLLAGVAAVGSERWSLAGACVALASFIKVYPLAIGLLLTAVYPRKFGNRFLLALGIGAALPFLFQHAGYVAQQYSHWYELLLADNRADRPVSMMCSRDLWLLIRLFHLPISMPTYRGIQLALAGAVASLCLAGRWWVRAACIRGPQQSSSVHSRRNCDEWVARPESSKGVNVLAVAPTPFGVPQGVPPSAQNDRIDTANAWQAVKSRRLHTMLFGLGIGWMVLCGPATESCTYILMAPVLAWAVLEAWLEPRPFWSRAIPWCSLCLFGISQIGSWFPDKVRMPFLGLLPLAGLLLIAGLLETNIRELFKTWREERATNPALPAQAA